MKLYKRQPKNVCFVTAWKIENDLFSKDFRYENGRLEEYDWENNDWKQCETQKATDTLPEGYWDLNYITLSKKTRMKRILLNEPV